MIKVENLSFGFPDKELYKNISFTLQEGAHCAFIGSNGTGKTTLVDMIMHDEEYLYDGKISKEDGFRIGYVSQFKTLDKEKPVTVFEYLSEKFVENQNKVAEICEKMADSDQLELLYEQYQALLDAFQSMDGDHYESNIRKLLSDVHMEKLENLLLHQLSNGEFKLLQVMKEMLLSPNLLIMDEPDAFLDFERLNGLCKLIRNYPGTVLVITHNRYLLNHCFDKILHLEDTDIQEFDGTYMEYSFALLKEKIERMDQSIKDQIEIERTEKMVERMRQNATNASIASLGRTVHAKQTHLDRLKDRKMKEPFLDLEIPDISLPAVEDTQEDEVILSVWDYEVSFDDLLLEDVSFELHNNEKIAIVGANGTGKTTLLFDIFRQKDKSITVKEGTKIALLSQTEEDASDQSLTCLSGGEKNLQKFKKIAESDANLLLLDEPTSHLDTRTQVALEDAICNYKGAVLMVSHDFYTITKCADSILYVDDKSVRPMRIRSFRKKVYEQYFNKEYLELEQQKLDLEFSIRENLKQKQIEKARKNCEKLENIIEKCRNIV